jgi:sialic acid synthase SpsE
MFVIAEIGTSHEGSLDKAKLLVEKAKDAGANCVKFQWVYADEILHPDTGFVNLPTGKIPLYQRFKELEVSPDFFYKLREFSSEINIDFMCSPFGPKSLVELLQINPDFIKIASPELNYIQLLQLLNEKNTNKIPVVLSSGVSKISDIENALECFSSLDDITLLHCVTSYPAPETDYNLNLIKNLSGIFGINTGVSDHSLSPYIVPLLSYFCGATMLEKHITLNNEDLGLDDPVALNIENFKKMTDAINQTKLVSKENLYLELKKHFGSIIDDTLGSGKKELAKSEKDNYLRTNRSLRFIKDLKQGDVIRSSDIGILRTEKVLEVGLHPSFLNNFIGKQVCKNIKSGDAVLWSCLIED